jgi:hypothetical protein
MSTITLKTSTEFVTVSCCACGVVFAVPSDLHEMWLAKKQDRSWWCPNGHSQSYTGKSDRELLNDARAARRRQEARADAAELALRDEREHAARRAAGGVCPCCHRSFVQLARHVKSKHPGYGPGPCSAGQASR